MILEKISTTKELNDILSSKEALGDTPVVTVPNESNLLVVPNVSPETCSLSEELSARFGRYLHLHKRKTAAPTTI
jgi:hypothetical protein